MKRKFKHYATDEISEFEVRNSHARIDNRWHKLEPFKNKTRVAGTSWEVYHD